MMKTFLKLAEDSDCEEVWLGARADNLVVRKLYESLDPEEIAGFVGYTFELDQRD